MNRSACHSATAFGLHQLRNDFPHNTAPHVVKMHPTDTKVFFEDLLAFDLPVLRRVVSFGENFQEKNRDVKYGNSFNGE
jgi:hypothetical protein